MEKTIWHLEKRGCDRPYRVRVIVGGVVCETHFFKNKNAAVKAFNVAAAQQETHLHDCTPTGD